MNKYHPLAWKPPQDFASTHCVKCKAGWTRTGGSGKALTVCLLDREPVLSGMTDCDRYEPRLMEAPEARPALPPKPTAAPTISAASSPPSRTITEPESQPPGKNSHRSQ